MAAGHTIGNGEPPGPLAPDVPFVGALVYHPVLLGDKQEVVRRDRDEIGLLAVYPLHAEELELKQGSGLGALLDRMDAAEVSELVERSRLEGPLERLPLAWRGSRSRWPRREPRRPGADSNRRPTA